MENQTGDAQGSRIKIRQRFFLWLARLAIHRRALIFSLVAVLSLAALATLPFIKIKTTRTGMHPKDLPEQIRFVKFQDEFGTSTQLVILLEGETAQIKAAADDIAQALSENPAQVRNVFHRVDLSFFEETGFYYLPLADLQKVEKFFLDHQGWVNGLLAAQSFPDAVEKMERASGRLSLEQDQAVTLLRMLDAGLIEWEKFLSDPRYNEFTVDRERIKELIKEPENDLAGDDGYLLGKDKRSAMLYVQQAETSDDSAFIVPFMKYCRETVTQALASHPGVTAGFTGWPVAVEEEVGGLRRDLALVTIFSTIVILLLLYFSFHSWTKTILVFMPLVFGVLWNTGLSYVMVGYISYFTSVFFGLLFSLGTEYGIIFMRRYREELLAGYEPETAMERTFVGVGPGLLTSASTTMAAFLAISFFDIPAFANMGIVAATGMLCLIVATLLILPPLMLIFRNKIATQAHVRVVGATVIDWFWRHLSRHPLIPVATGFCGAICAAFLLPYQGFDYNVNHLLPADSETTIVTEKLDKAMGHETQFIAVMADNLEQVRSIAKLLESRSTVAKVESPAPLIPADQNEKQATLRQIAATFEKMPPLTPAKEPDLTMLQRQIAAMIDRLTQHLDSAVYAGQTKLIEPLESLVNRLESIHVLLEHPQGRARQAAFERNIVEQINRARERLLTMLHAAPIAPDNLPDNLRRRFVGADGKLAIMAFPSQNIWDPDFLARFVKEVRGAAGQVLGEEEALENTTGFGVVYLTTSHMISSGFRFALLTTVVVVLFLLFLDFRRPIPALLAALPFVISMGITLGLLILFRVELNMASQLALPVLVGIGVDFGVHTVHRWREADGDDLAKVVSTIGGAIWLSGATNMAGFGALMLASYRGLTTFGAILFLGIFLASSGALFGIPAVIRTLHLDRRALGK